MAVGRHSLSPILGILGSALLVACNALPAGGTRPPREATPPTPPATLTPTPTLALPPASPLATPLRTTEGASSVPLCDDVPYLYAPEELYERDVSKWVDTAEDMALTVRNWARGKPGFEELWIDRSQHNGWLTLAFSRDAAERQQDVESEFPNMAVVVVGVSWTMADLERLQRQVTDSFRSSSVGFGSGIYVNKGVVSIDLGVRRPELVAKAEELFADDPICVSGLDPALAPVEGPQPQSGDGWRLLADEDRSGQSYRTGIAYDGESYTALWSAAGLEGERPDVDFESEVVLWFGAVHGSSCPRIRLDNVTTDRGGSLVYSVITYLDVGICTADAIPHAYVVAFERSYLPTGEFTIQLQREDPPSGVIDEERTIVEVDLSAPGSTAGPGEVHPTP